MNIPRQRKLFYSIGRTEAYIDISNATNKLTDKVIAGQPIFSSGRKIETLMLTYYAISCSCAQWVLNRKSKQDLSKSEQIFIEPANEHLINSNNEWDGKTLPYEFKLRGSFYTEKRIS